MERRAPTPKGVAPSDVLRPASCWWAVDFACSWLASRLQVIGTRRTPVVAPAVTTLPNSLEQPRYPPLSRRAALPSLARSSRSTRLSRSTSKAMS